MNKTWRTIFMSLLLMTMVGTTYLYNFTMPIVMVLAIAYLSITALAIATEFYEKISLQVLIVTTYFNSSIKIVLSENVDSLFHLQ